jgi:hypothetical protein
MTKVELSRVDGGRALAPRAPSRRFWVALVIAIIADVLQLAIFPLFGEGAASPLDDGLDVVVAASLIALLGFEWALLPAFVAELVPLADLAPTWTAAVLFVAWRKKRKSKKADAQLGAFEVNPSKNGRDGEASA